MNLKRIFLVLLTILALVLVGTSLVNSWTKPQFQSRLELRQADLVLLASEGPLTPVATAGDSLRRAVLSEDPIANASQQYQELYQTVLNQLLQQQERYQMLGRQLEIAQSTQSERRVAGLKRAMEQVNQIVQERRILLAELNLRLGVLQARQGQTSAALATWQKVVQRPETLPMALPIVAETLNQLWSEPPTQDLVFQDAETLIQENLEGWFRHQALAQLYQKLAMTDRLQSLTAQQQQQAQEAFRRLVMVGVLYGVGIFGGTLLVLGVIVEGFLAGKKSLLASPLVVWTIPWDGETIWQVFVVGFFFLGQFVVPQLLIPLALQLLKLNPTTLENRGQAGLIFISYTLVALGSLLVLWQSLRPFRPLPTPIFHIRWRGRWWLWGLGGYLAAVPVVVLVSLLNAQIWQGQGGSNPILPIALGGKDPITLLLFCLTASVAAPAFEEIMFRGFLLPSLTRYVPTWSAIGLSSLLFAIVHLSVSEILPLTALGVILGFVYSRSRNLLAPILMHSLWNGGTLFSLFVLSGS